MKLRKTLWAAALSAVILAACSGGGNNDGNTTSANSGGVSGNSLISRINNHGTVSIGTEGTYAPFTYHDESGKLTGYDVEVARAVAKKLDFEIKFEETQWDAMLAGLKGDRFDMVANQVALTTPERRATFDKSADYSYSGPMALTRTGDNRIKNITDIKGMKAAQTLSSNYGEMAVANGANIIPVDGMAQALTLVQQKRAEVTLNDSLALLDYLKKTPNSGLQVAWRSGADEKIGSGFILNKGNSEALAKISQAVDELRQDGTLKKLGEQFFGEDVSKP